MQRSSRGKIDPVQMVLGTLFLVVTVSIVCSPYPSNLYKLMALVLLMGLLYFYSGMKKHIQARVHRQSSAWYKQPGTLFSLSLLLGVLPWLLQDEIISKTLPNAATIQMICSLVFSAVTLLFLLAAMYFFFTGHKQRHKRQGQQDESSSLRQVTRTGPQPKEAREEEMGPMHMR